jgi:hypothetical protein
VTLSLRRVSLAASLYYMFCALVCGAQNINVDQIRTGTTNNGNVVTTVNGTSVWGPAPGGIPSAQGTAPIQVNGASGVPATGAITVACPTCGAGILQTQVVPPVSGQFVAISATSNVATSAGTVTAASSNTSGVLTQAACNASSPPCSDTHGNNILWSGFQLPSGVAPSSVTEVIAYISASLAGSAAGAAVTCTNGSTTFGIFLPHEGNATFGSQPLSVVLSGVTGSQIPSITCSAGMDILDPNPPQVFSVDMLQLLVYYTGSPVQQPDLIAIASPLTFNSASETLGFNTVYNYGTSGGSSDAYTLSLPALSVSLTQPNLLPQIGQEVLWTPSFANTTTSPTLNLNGSGAASITKGPGHAALASGDLNGNVADTIFDGLDWELQNPQTSSGGGRGTITLTGPVTGSGTSTIATTITPTGVTAGSYTNPNITLNAAGQVLAASNGSGGSGSISVNGASVSSPNLNGTTPAAPSGSTNCAWQVSGSSVSCSVPTASGSAITALTGDGTASGTGSVAFTAVNLPGHISLAGTPSVGMVPTATSPTAATWQTPTASGSANGVQTYKITNDSSGGTAVNLMACWTVPGSAPGLISTCPAASAGAGTNNPRGYVGVVIAGAGTSGLATVAFDGAVQWICDSNMVVGMMAMPSASVAGECTESNSDSNLANPSTPDSATILGRVLIANSGPGTAATVQMAPFFTWATNNSNISLLGAYAMLTDGNGSSFLTQSETWQQAPSNYTSGGRSAPFAWTGTVLALNSGNINQQILIGDLGEGVGGNDLSIATGAGAFFSEAMVRFDSAYYSPLNTLSGTSLNVNPASTPVNRLVLTGNTTSTITADDNPGDVLYFDIVQVSSGGPFTFTWPSNFVNPPTVSVTAGASTLASFLFDGTNYQCVAGCAGSGGGAVSSVFGRTGGVTANSGDYTVSQVTGAAPLASPTFTGIPAAPTAAASTNTTQLATTAFVTAALAAAGSAAGIVTYSGPSLTFTGTAFFPIGGGGLSSTTETNVDLAAPATATVKNFTVQLSVAPGTGNSIAFTWRDNATSTAITCTVSGSATSCSDLTHSFTASAGDFLDIQAVTSGTIISASTAVMGTQVGVASSSGVTGGSLTISSGTQGANSCASVATVTDTGLTASGAFSRPTIAYSGSTSGLTGWGAASPGMKLNFFTSSANTMGYEICNYSSSSISYSAITFQLGAS